MHPQDLYSMRSIRGAAECEGVEPASGVEPLTC